MNHILVLFAHPAFQKSRVNKILVQGLDNIEGITFFDLYENYPELDIDISHQQELVVKHQIIIFPDAWKIPPAIASAGRSIQSLLIMEFRYPV